MTTQHKPPLHALYEYYNRKRSEADNSEMAPLGWEWKEIAFTIVLDEEGRFFDVDDNRGEKNKGAKLFLVPKGVDRSSGIAANMLWDNSAYTLGYSAEDDSRVHLQHQAFLQKIHDYFPDPQIDSGINALLTFLEKRDFAELFHHARWQDIVASSGNISFRLEEDFGLICEREVVVYNINHAANNEEAVEAQCLITGKNAAIARLHPVVKGVWGAQTAGARIVSFNAPAFISYLKEGENQRFNASVSEEAAFAYTTALNYLLRKGSKQRMQVGDASTVFWTEQAHSVEEVFADIWGASNAKEDSDRRAKVIKDLYESPKTAAYCSDDGDNTIFYILGISPNAARLSIRFWYMTTVGVLAEHIRQHFNDIAIIHRDYEDNYLTLYHLLAATALARKLDNVNPTLAGETMRSILAGLPYPRLLLQTILTRSKAERNVSYAQAATIKGWLNRHNRYYQLNQKELTVSLDEENSHPAYCMGRLFSLLEKIQEEANPGLNATIRDRYYSAASTRPAAILTMLIKLAHHHLAKIRKEKLGLAIKRDKEISDIIQRIQEFPSILSLEEQGLFVIGYYHQRQALFTKSTTTNEEKE